MKLKQISLFLENKPGHLSAVCRLLAENRINILTLSLADTEQFGILRLIVEDWGKTKEVLEKAGNVVTVTDVVATEVEDRPGGLAELLSVVQEAGINIEYMYAFTFRSGGRAIMIFRFDDPDAAITALQRRGFNVLQGVDLFERAKA
ncbi:ACT domain-containing protein [Thermopirellula anaerolimosa]